MRFSEKADRYEERAFIQADMAEWLAEGIGRVRGIQEPVLELGAGTGFFTRLLTEHFNNLLATDVSEAMVALGKERVPGVSWEVCNGWNLSSGDWSAIFSSSLLQWCPDPAFVFSSWDKVLKPGAQMLHGFFVEGTLSEIQEIAPDCLAVKFHSGTEWAAYFEAAGYQVLDMDIKQVSYGFASAMELFRYLHGIGATLGPRRIKPTILRKIIEACDLNRSQNIEGEVKSQWVFSRILCKKTD